MVNEKYRIPQIGKPSDTRVFSLVEAESLLPVVQKLTRRAVIELEPIQLSYRKHLDCDPRKSQLALDYERVVRSWIRHMQRLGLVVRGLWKVDFDTGDGYLSWRYPELRLAFFVDLHDPNAVRQSLPETLAKLEPSWAY